MFDLTSPEKLQTKELFTYDSLEQDADQPSIRLIQVDHELHASGLIQIRIVHSNVAASYSAISYVWGAQAERHRIVINDRIGTVGSNLHRHLCNLRTFERDRLFWVDALSIDQQNISERSQQVKLMAEIFEGAKDVLAFIPIGLDSRVLPQSPFEVLTTKSTLDALAKELTKAISVESTGLARSAKRISQIFGNRTPKAPRRADVPAFAALSSAATTICYSRYWSRTWIIQEVALARNLQLTDGQYKIPWDCFFELIGVLAKFEVQGASRFTVPDAVARLQDLREGTRRSTLAALTSDFKRSLCADFHDKIYGLLSLLQNGHRFLVDYTSNQLDFFLSALEFGRGPGADFDAEAQAFVLARTLFESLPLKASTVVEQARAAQNMPYVRCRASKLPLKRSFDEDHQLYTCPTCSHATPSFNAREFHTIYCLDLEGSHQHLISEEVDSSEQHQNNLSDQVQIALVVMVRETPPECCTRIEDLPDWDKLSPFTFWNAQSLDTSRSRYKVNVRCHLLDQKIDTPRLSVNGLFYEIDLPVTVFVSMALRETNHVDSLIGRYHMRMSVD